MSEIEVKVSSYGPKRKCLMMRYTDPVTGKRQARSTGTTNRREAERVAAKWEAELREGRYQSPSTTTWGEFLARYQQEHFPHLAEKSQEAASVSLGHLGRIVNPDRLVKLTSDVMSRFQTTLRGEGMRDTTIAHHLRGIRAGLNWAVRKKMLAEMPDINMPRRAKGRTLMRGRPITAEEFDRMIAAVPKVRPHDPGNWQRYLTGLWLSGLRLEESTVLSWDDDAPLAIDQTGRHPRIRVYAEGEKGNRDRYLPMTPDLAEWILQTPEDEREGRVFKLERLDTGQPMTAKRVGRIVSKIGERAGVIVNKAEGKYASAHDLRRAFGTRWAPKVKPATLQLLMRHSSIQTTLDYYVAQDADDVGDELWANHSAGNTLATPGVSDPQEEERGSAVNSTEPQSKQAITSNPTSGQGRD